MSSTEILRSRTFARDRRTWIATIAIALVLWASVDAWLNRRIRLVVRTPAPPESDGRFVVLAFDRIVAMPDGRNLDRLRLRDELRGLAAAGWQPVTLAELSAAYRGESRLPARALLVTFDQGYLGTYEAADPVLRELRWPAVMFLETGRPEARDVSFLFWDRLRRMEQSGLWEIASGDPAPAETKGKPGRFPPGAALISERLDTPPAPFWAPRGTEPRVALGLGDGSTPAGWIGFLDDAIGANDPASDPLRIARLRVDPRWTTEALLARASSAIAEAPQRVESVVLAGRPRAEAWLPAARWADDWQLDATFDRVRGEFWIVQRGALPGHEWRVGTTDDGVYIEARVPGRPPEVLARGPARGGTHRVSVVKRGGGVLVTWDGRPLAATPVTLPERGRGPVGLVAYARDGEAVANARAVSLTRFPYLPQLAPASPSAGDVLRWTVDARSIGGLSPPWARVEGAAVRETGFDRDLFRMVGRRYAWDVLPTVEVGGNAPPAGEAADFMKALPGRIRREGWAGVRVDLRAVGTTALPPWREATQELGAALRRDHLRLVQETP
ncbi:MAG TPA: polysaccharide deacetylase family protein [Candidatus Polarisedimenticolaceae bacterium]|nr:polysaccharide deacetylase family protein [Candidatus Polarisedimenticolaceae bacterium]